MRGNHGSDEDSIAVQELTRDCGIRLVTKPCASGSEKQRNDKKKDQLS